MEGRVFKILIFYNKDEKDHYLSKLRESITKHLQERLQGFTYQIEIDSSKDIVEHIISNPVRVMEDIILSLTERVQQSDLILVDITYENINIGIEIGRYIESSSKYHLFFIHESKAENRVNKQNLPFYLKYKRVYDLNLEEDKKFFLEEIYNYFKSIIYSPYHRFRISLDEVKTILSDIDNINNFKILKAPNAALVLGEYAVTTGKMAIYLPIPSTNYIAIREVNTPSSSISYYFPFLKENLCEKRNHIKWLSLAIDISKKRLIKRLDSILNTKLDIRIFTKLPPLCGLASSSIIASAIALYMYKKEVKKCIDLYKRYLKNKEDKDYLNEIDSIMSIILDTRARINDIFIINFMQNQLTSCDIEQDKIKYIINNSRLFDYRDQIVLIELYKNSVDIVQNLFLEILNFYSSLLRLLQSFKKRFPKLFENIRFQIRDIKYIKFKNFSSISSNLLNNKIRKIIEEVSQFNLFDLDDDLLEDSINIYYSLSNLTVGIKDITVKKYIELYNRIMIDVKNLEKSLEIIINIFNNDKYKNLLLISKENKIEYFYITKKITLTIDLIIKIISSLNIYIASDNILNSLKEIIEFSFIKKSQSSNNNIEYDRLSISQITEKIDTFIKNKTDYKNKIVKSRIIISKKIDKIDDNEEKEQLEKEVKELKNELKNKIEGLKGLENKIEELEKLEGLKNKIEELEKLENRIEKLEGLGKLEEKEQLEKEVKELKNELKNKIEGLGKELKNKIEELKKLEGLENKIEGLKGLENKIEELKGLENKIEELENRIEKLEGLGKLEEKEQLEKEVKELKNELKNKIEELGKELKNKIEELKKLEGLENKIEELEKLEELKNKIEELENKIEELKGLENKIEELENRIEKLKGLGKLEEKEQLEKEVKELKNKIEELEEIGKIEELKNKIEGLEELKNKIEGLGKELKNELKNKIEELKKLEGLKNKIEGLEKQLLITLLCKIHLPTIYKDIYINLIDNLIVHKYLCNKSNILFPNKILPQFDEFSYSKFKNKFKSKIDIINHNNDINKNNNQLSNIVRECNSFNLLLIDKNLNNKVNNKGNDEKTGININKLYEHFHSAKELFVKVFKQAFKIDNKVFHGERGSGAGCFAILAGTSNLNPVIYWSQERKINDKDSSNDENSEAYNWALKDEDINKIKCYGIRLDDFDPSASFIDYVGHFGLVFSGSTKVTEQLLEELKEEENFRIINKIQEIQNHPHLGFEKNSNYLEVLFNLYGKITLQGLEYYFRGKSEFGSIDKEKFLTSIQLSQKLFEYVAIYNIPHFTAPLPPDYYPYYIVQAFNNFSIEIGRPVFAAKVTGGGKGGDILVLSDITDKEEFNIHFFNVLNTIRQKVISQKPELVEKIGKEHFLSSWLNRDKDFDVKGINFVDIK